MRIEIEDLYKAFNGALELVEDERQRERLKRVLGASRAAVEHSAYDLVSKVAAAANSRLNDHRIDLAYRDGGLELEVTETSRQDGDDEPWPEDDGDLEKFTLRIPGWLKDEANRAAADSGRSLNSWMTHALASELRHRGRWRRDRGERAERPERGERRKGPGQSLRGWIGE